MNEDLLVLILNFVDNRTHHLIAVTSKCMMTMCGVPLPNTHVVRNAVMWCKTVVLPRRTTDLNLRRFCSYAIPSSICVSGSNITDTGLQNLSSCPLEYLKLSFCNSLTNEGIECLLRGSSVKRLAVWYCKQVNLLLCFLVEIPELRITGHSGNGLKIEKQIRFLDLKKTISWEDYKRRQNDLC